MEEKSAVLQAEHVTKSYGTARGIIDLSLSVQAGEIFGFIGPNGAGKSTAIRTILGLLFPDSGSISLFGQDALKSGSLLRRRIGFVPSDVNYYYGLKTGQLLSYAASFYRNTVDNFSELTDRINAFSDRLKLDLSRPIADLSLGNKKKVGIIQALIHKPDLLILDEPTSGLDPLIQSRFYQILKEEQKRGATVFFSSHTLSEVERLCSRVAIIREGRIVKVSGMEQLKQLYLKRFRLLLPARHNFTEQKMLQLLPDAVNITITGRAVEGLFGGDVRILMNALSGLPVSDAVIEDPGLEEIFMHYYSDKGTSE